ncbi:helix-turn-helix transcriptional regulator, partial [Streptomyces sp. SJL17-4]|uniref:helix-turn-helix domain-containing protein n=1 Tax=Streptomyces sp. SJL17-4 TaxID=2967224 RepID=UPI0030CDD853
MNTPLPRSLDPTPGGRLPRYLLRVSHRIGISRGDLAHHRRLKELQTGLRHLLKAAGLSVRGVAERVGVPESTVFDVLQQDRPPRPDVVAEIAHACGAPPGPWRDAAAGLATTGPTTDQAPDPADLIIKAAATRPPAEVAELVTSLRAGGRPDVAARLIEAAAKTRPAPEVADLAMALLDLSSHREEANGTGPNLPQGPAPQPEVPAPRTESPGWFL